MRLHGLSGVDVTQACYPSFAQQRWRNKTNAQADMVHTSVISYVLIADMAGEEGGGVEWNAGDRKVELLSTTFLLLGWQPRRPCCK